jgi:hypothetical protein
MRVLLLNRKDSEDIVGRLDRGKRRRKLPDWASPQKHQGGFSTAARWGRVKHESFPDIKEAPPDVRVVTFSLGATAGGNSTDFFPCFRPNRSVIVSRVGR